MNEIGGYFQQILPLTSSYNQKTRPGRQRLQRNRKAWPGYEVIGYYVYGSVHVDTETNSYNQKTRLGRRRLRRKENNWPGSEVIGDNVQCSILTNKGKKFKDIRGNIPNPGSSSKVKAKENVDDKKETLVGSMISNVSISEGSEVIGDNFHVAEIKSKDKTRPGRQRLQRNGKAWPGDELTGDNVYVSIHVGTEVKLNDSCSLAIKCADMEESFRNLTLNFTAFSITSKYYDIGGKLQPSSKVIGLSNFSFFLVFLILVLVLGPEVVGDSVHGSVLTYKEKKLKNETFDAKTSVVSSEDSDEMIGNAVPGPVLMVS
ncbi:hypothetical protein WN943_006317 [Citrus x changshan-huyou]